MSREIVVSKQAIMAPYICARCRAQCEIRDYMVDTGIDFEFEGVVYICAACMKDIVRAIPDAYTPEQYNEMYNKFMDTISDMSSEIEYARALNNRLKELDIHIGISYNEPGNPSSNSVVLGTESLDSGSTDSESNPIEFTSSFTSDTSPGDDSETLSANFAAITFGN